MIGDYLEHYFTNNPNLKSKMRIIPFNFEGVVFNFLSDLGVFSKNHIDYGSFILAKTIILNEKRKCLQILDVGCGYGFLGICLAKMLDSTFLGVDVNEKALDLCKKNIFKNNIKGEVKLSNAYEKVLKKYDLIVTNPPIRAGNKVVLNILIEAQNYLNKDGCLWFVIRKDQGVKSIIKKLESYYKIEIMQKSKGFYCILAKVIDKERAN